jgi:hypothetical protein
MNIESGGPTGNRTRVRGFAVLYVTTPPSGLDALRTAQMLRFCRAVNRDVMTGWIIDVFARHICPCCRTKTQWLAVQDAHHPRTSSPSGRLSGTTTPRMANRINWRSQDLCSAGKPFVSGSIPNNIPFSATRAAFAARIVERCCRGLPHAPLDVPPAASWCHTGGRGVFTGRIDLHVGDIRWFKPTRNRCISRLARSQPRDTRRRDN